MKFKDALIEGKYGVAFQVAWISLLVCLLFMPEHAFSATVGAGGGLPYEDGLTAIRDSVTGPVAFTLSIVGIVVAGGVLVFGGELGSFFRSLIFLALVIALIVGSNNLLTGVFGAGAEITQSSERGAPTSPFLRNFDGVESAKRLWQMPSRDVAAS